MNLVEYHSTSLSAILISPRVMSNSIQERYLVDNLCDNLHTDRCSLKFLWRKEALVFFFFREHTPKVIPDVKIVHSTKKKIKKAYVCNNHAAYSQLYIFDWKISWMCVHTHTHTYIHKRVQAAKLKIMLFSYLWNQSCSICLFHLQMRILQFILHG